VSVTTTINALATQFQAITTPQVLAAIYTEPREGFSAAQLPCMILAEAPGIDHKATPQTFSQGHQLWLHEYTISGYLLLGMRNTPLNTLYLMQLGWPEALMQAIGNDLTEGGLKSLGQGSGPVMSYKIGPIAWGDQEFWGITAQYPVTEYIQF